MRKLTDFDKRFQIYDILEFEVNNDNILTFRRHFLIFQYHIHENSNLSSDSIEWTHFIKYHRDLLYRYKYPEIFLYFLEKKILKMINSTSKKEKHLINLRKITQKKKNNNFIDVQYCHTINQY